MARRWFLTAVLAAVLVAAGVLAAHAIRDDGAETAARATTVTAESTTSSSATSTIPTSTTVAGTSSSPTTTGPPGPCGPDTGAIRAAVDGAVGGAAQNADIASCRLAASDRSWAAVDLAAKPGAEFAAVTVVAHSVAGSWSVVAQGSASAGCGRAPQQVIVDLGQSCAGTGGGAQ